MGTVDFDFGLHPRFMSKNIASPLMTVFARTPFLGLSFSILFWGNHVGINVSKCVD
jgi:hypothetical protein